MKIFATLMVLGLLVSGCSSYSTSRPVTAPGSGTSTANTGAPLINRLNLSHQQLTQVPADTFRNADLQELDLSYNQLTGALPAEVRQLKNLQVLDLSHNKFTGVPAEIGQLSELRILNLADNQLTGLPYELGNLKKLQILNLSGNAYSQLDLGIIVKQLPTTVKIVK